MSVQLKKRSSKTKVAVNTKGKENKSIMDYSQEPFFEKMADEAKEIIDRYGLPDKLNLSRK